MDSIGACAMIMAKITKTDKNDSIIEKHSVTKVFQRCEALISHSVGVEDSGLPGCYTVCLTSWLLTFRREVSPLSSKRKESSTLEDERYTSMFFRNGAIQ